MLVCITNIFNGELYKDYALHDGMLSQKGTLNRFRIVPTNFILELSITTPEQKDFNAFSGLLSFTVIFANSSYSPYI